MSAQYGCDPGRNADPVRRFLQPRGWIGRFSQSPLGGGHLSNLQCIRQLVQTFGSLQKTDVLLYTQSRSARKLTWTLGRSNTEVDNGGVSETD